jgi:hypothetical protein
MALEQLLSTYPENVVALTNTIRKYLLLNFPMLSEEVDLVSKILVYTLSAGMKGIVFTIILSQKGVKLGFYRGIDLADPAHLLEGNGKVHKYIQMSEDLLQNANFQKITASAFETARERTGR